MLHIIHFKCLTYQGYGRGHSRNLLQVKHAFELIRVIFELLLASKDDTFMVLAAAAYGMVFAAHHEQPIKNAALEAMYDLPTRSQLLQMANEDGESAILTSSSPAKDWAQTGEEGSCWLG
ncbi:accelerated cell death 11-like [Phoenix dactylifera]|uniref:Accelerated cell death 11-like n=1 Tax=Phoenix dactylifera TaxID=42345 RepID=A0A8B9AM26_PHODC|nr:accelerated cell death 11-like [Phoenix dactylifera]